MFNYWGQSAVFSNKDQVEALKKSLTVTGATDSAALVGGDALRKQSLDAVLKTIVQDFNHFALFNKLPVHTATSFSDEWVEQSSIGGFLGGSTTTATGAGFGVNGGYTRRTLSMAVFNTFRSVPILQDVQDVISPLLITEQINGVKQLISEFEYLSFEGNRSIVPTEMDGLFTIAKAAGSDFVINMDGKPLNTSAKLVEAAQVISGYGQFGFPTDVFWNNRVQADMDNGLESTYRVNLDGNPNSYMTGSPVAAIRTLWGNIKTNWDVFIRDETMQAPFEVYQPALAALVGACASVPTATPTGTDGQWTTTNGRTGNYYYAVTCISPGNGTTIPPGTQSVVSKSAAITVGSGEHVPLVITASAGGTETGYVVYRSKQNGTNTTSNFREVGRIAKAGATTTFIDYNNDIPGTTKAYVLSMNPNTDAISRSVLIEPSQIPMATINTPTSNFLVVSAMALRVTKSRQHVVIKNILPTSSAWRPFTAE